ncbi:MAG: hypothetical protein IKT50_00500 [Clostridia bacterium]|nr:hypothetical protein [Clostridia bacterium]
MKRLIAFVLLIVFVLSFTACGGEQVESDIPEGFLLAENKGADYLFYYPETWLLDRHDAGMTSAYVSETDYSNVSVTAFTASLEYPDLVSYVENYYFKQFEDNFQNLTVEKNQDGSLKRSVLKIDGCDAVAVNYTAAFGGENYAFRAWFVSYNGYIYTVLYTAKEAAFDANLELATKIAEYIRFN